MPQPAPRQFEPVPAPKTVDDLVDERLGTLEGQQSHVLQLADLARQVLEKYELADSPSIAAEITSVMYAAKVKQLSGLLREKERDICDKALNKYEGSYDRANFAVVQGGIHQRVDSQIQSLQAAILDHEDTLAALAVS